MSDRVSFYGGFTVLYGIAASFCYGLLLLIHFSTNLVVTTNSLSDKDYVIDVWRGRVGGVVVVGRGW